MQRKKIKKTDKIKLSSFLIMLVLVVIISIMLTRIVFYSLFVGDIKEIDVSVTVVAPTKHIGINLDTDALKFSTMPPGRQATKFVNISSEYPAIVFVKTEGEIGKWLIYENKFRINANEPTILNVTMVVPADAKLGDYKGKLVILLLKS